MSGVPERGRRISITVGGENLQRTRITVTGIVEDVRGNGVISVLLDPPRTINREYTKRIIATPEVVLGWQYAEEDGQ